MYKSIVFKCFINYEKKILLTNTCITDIDQFCHDQKSTPKVPHLFSLEIISCILIWIWYKFEGKKSLFLHLWIKFKTKCIINIISYFCSFNLPLFHSNPKRAITYYLVLFLVRFPHFDWDIVHTSTCMYVLVIKLYTSIIWS